MTRSWRRRSRSWGSHGSRCSRCWGKGGIARGKVELLGEASLWRWWEAFPRETILSMAPTPPPSSLFPPRDWHFQQPKAVRWEENHHKENWWSQQQVRMEGAFVGRLGCKTLEEAHWNTLRFELFVPLSCTCPVPSCRKEGVLFPTVVRNL